MKNIGVLIAGLLLTTSLFSQDYADNEPADEFKLDVFTDIWLGAPDSAEISSINPGFGVAYLKDFPLNATWSVAIGGRFRTAHIFMKTKMVGLSDSLGTYTSFDNYSASESLKRAQFASHSFEVPVEFRWHSKLNGTGNRWKIALGAKVGYAVNQYFKWNIDGVGKYRDYILSDVDPLNYGAYLRLGIAGFGIYANYNISPVFKSDRSAAVTPLTIGITLLPR